MGMPWFTKPHFIAIVICTLLIAGFPSKAPGFWDEDSLKITGITMGAVLALGILVVIVAGTIEDLKQQGEEKLSQPLHESYACDPDNVMTATAVNKYAMTPCLFSDPYNKFSNEKPSHKGSL